MTSPSPRRHPIYGLPFDGAIANDLEREYRSKPWGWRATVQRKRVQREWLLALTGQRGRRRRAVDIPVRRLLWIYTWTTVGDSIMDLAVRQHFPSHWQVELCISPELAGLWRDDPRWHAVHTSIEDCRGPFDYVLMQDLSTSSLKMKLRCGRDVPFSTVFEYLRGERFDRMAFAQRRLEQLLGLAVADPAPPRLWVQGDSPFDAGAPRTRLAVALGARDPRRRYRHWPEVLRVLAQTWPQQTPALEFVLMGRGNARDDVAAMAPHWLHQHARDTVDRLDLHGSALTLKHCDGFVGVDGGLMHMAAAFDRPGAAIFTEIEPRLRLSAISRLTSLYTPQDINSIEPQRVAAAVIASMRPGTT